MIGVSFLWIYSLNYCLSQLRPANDRILYFFFPLIVQTYLDIAFAYFVSCLTIKEKSFQWVSGSLQLGHWIFCMVPVIHMIVRHLFVRQLSSCIAFWVGCKSAELVSAQFAQWRTSCSPQESRQQLDSVCKDAEMQRMCLCGKSMNICHYDTISWCSLFDAFWCFYVQCAWFALVQSVYV